MKAYLPYILLFCSSFTSASPIQTVVPTNLPSRTSLDIADYTNTFGEHAHSPNPKSQAYGTQPPFQSHAPEHYAQESQLGLPQYTPAPLLHSKASRYGTFFGKSINSTRWYTKEAKPLEDDTNSTGYRNFTMQVVDIIDFIDQLGPEFVALTLFIFVPLAYLVLGMLELAAKRYTREQFPHRGRDQIRLFGPERQLRAWSNMQREKLLQNEKRWWQTQRARS